MKKKPKTAPFIWISTRILTLVKKIATVMPIKEIRKIISGMLRICPCLDYLILNMRKNRFLK